MTSSADVAEVNVAASPDGRFLAYSDGGTALEIVDLTGRVHARIAPPGSVALWWSAWSPDGRKLTFNSRDTRGYSRIYVVNADGSGLRPITRGAIDMSPAWSPDGSWIAFVRVAEYRSTSSARARHLYLVRPDGSYIKKLTFGSFEIFRPSWSPDGRSLAFAGWQAESTQGAGGAYVHLFTTDIWVMDVRSREIRRLTSGPEDDFSPCWSPDGARIAFTRASSAEAGHQDIGGVYETVHSDIYSMDPKGDDVELVTNTPLVAEDSCAWARA